MGVGTRDEENPVSDEENEAEAEKKVLKPPTEEDGIEMQKIPVKTRDRILPYPEVIKGIDAPFIKAHHLKYILLGFNFFLTVLGLALLSLSIWIRVDPELFQYESKLQVDNFKAVGIMFVLSSIIVLVIGFLGCIGAATERRWMLLLYIGVFAIVFIIQLAAVIMMWSAPYSTTITKTLENKLQEQINQRQEYDSSRFLMDFIQEHLECCGSRSFKDYGDQESPHSCRDQDTGNLHEEGCASKMLAYLRHKSAIIGAVALPILLIQLLAILASGCLIRSLEVESRYFM